MAIYEYGCESCDSVFQMNFPMGKASQTAKCPSCKRSGKRIYSGFMFFSKGESATSSFSSGKGCSTCATRNCASCS